MFCKLSLRVSSQCLTSMFDFCSGDVNLRSDVLPYPGGGYTRTYQLYRLHYNSMLTAMVWIYSEFRMRTALSHIVNKHVEMLHTLHMPKSTGSLSTRRLCVSFVHTGPMHLAFIKAILWSNDRPKILGRYT